MFFKSKPKEKFDWILAGLGNPGEKYEYTRHNIGFMVVDAIAAKYKIEWKAGSNIYWMANWSYAGKKICLLKPTTYMNNSGEAIKKVCERHFVQKTNVTTIVDEYNFPVGKIHIKNTGGAGGHNGVQSVINELGLNNFYKLRCGIGKGFEPGGMVDYVLSNFEPEVKEDLEKMINDSIKAMEHFFKSKPMQAMSDINSGKLFAEKVEESDNSKEIKE